MGVSTEKESVIVPLSPQDRETLTWTTAKDPNPIVVALPPLANDEERSEREVALNQSEAEAFVGPAALPPWVT